MRETNNNNCLRVASVYQCSDFIPKYVFSYQDGALFIQDPDPLDQQLEIHRKKLVQRFCNNIVVSKQDTSMNSYSYYKLGAEVLQYVCV